ncbi:MAG: response regulator [Cyclobacteriaceae bacterium]
MSQIPRLDLQHFSVKDGLSSPSVNTIFKDSQGFIWIATADGLNRFDGHEFKHFTKKKHGLISDNIVSIQEDEDQNLWLIHDNLKDGNTSRGKKVDIFNLQTYQVQHFDQAFGGQAPFISDDIVFVYSNQKKGIWICTKNGEIYTYQNKLFVPVFQSMDEEPREILHVDDEAIWLSENGKKILKVNSQGAAIKEFNFDKSVHKVNVGNSKRLMLFQPEERKLLRPVSRKNTWQVIDLKSSQLPGFFFNSLDLATHLHYSPRDSLLWYLKKGRSDHSLFFHPFKEIMINIQPEIDRFFANGSAKVNETYIDSQNRLWIATEDGFLIASLQKNASDPLAHVILSAPLRITSCQVLNRKTGIISDKTTQLINNERLILSPLIGSFEMELALLNYHKTYQNTFSYNMEGLDKRWTKVQGNRFRINDLPYGSYVLHIKGQDGDGQFASNDLNIPITMIRPFFMTKTFLACVIFIIILLVFLFFRSRIRRLQKAKVSLQETVKQRIEEIQRQKDEIEEQALKLNELDKLKSRFFANISHELRTPLTLILGHLEILKQEHAEEMSDKAQTYLRISKQNSQRLLVLVEEILDLSKLESGELQLIVKPVRLQAVIHHYFDMFRSFASQKEIDFSMDFNLSQELVIELDQNKFEKILTNLLSNAVKYTENGGRIELTVDEWTPNQTLAGDGQSNIRLQIKDTGRGIHSDDLAKIFDRFYQSAQPNIVAEGGAGLGLALAKELAELMNGTLTVQSVLGMGSTFTLTIPKVAGILPPQIDRGAFEMPSKKIASSDYTLDFELASENNPQKHKKAPVILIVEDHDQMRAYVRQAVAPYYQIQEAKDGIEALRKLKKHKIDLVISDVMMPRMDGFQLLKEIKEEEKFGDLPMIMLTARAAHEDKLHALTIGVDDYLTKPFNPKELLVRIKNLLKNQLKREKSKKETADLADEVFVSLDQQFVQRVEELVQDEISNSQLSVLHIAEKLNISEVQLFRKLKNFTGLTPIKFIREIRLQEAQKLLEGQNHETISEVMYAVGFRQAGYFAKRYAARFGKLPSEYFE